MGAAEAIFAQLTGDAPTAALIGDRVMPEPVPQLLAGTYPRIVYEIDDTIDATRHYGGVGGLYHSHGSMICMATTRLGAKTLAETANAPLDGKFGTWGGTIVVRAFTHVQDDVVERSPDEGEQRIIYEKRIDFDIWHR